MHFNIKNKMLEVCILTHPNIYYRTVIWSRLVFIKQKRVGKGIPLLFGAAAVFG